MAKEIKLDKVAETYKGNRGEKHKRDIQKRFDWLISRIDGRKILDVGCSQGIFDIRLLEARDDIESIFAIDVAEESIAYANDFLSRQPREVQDAITYIADDFLKMDEGEIFDSIVMGEVLEHLHDPKAFIAKAYKLLPPQGKLIITVPFAINDSRDHKRTYYYGDLHEQLLPEFNVLEYEILGEWIGVVAVKDLAEGQEINLELLKDIEQGFYNIERSLRDKIAAKDQRISRMLGEREKSNNRIENFKETIHKKNARIAKLEKEREVLRERVKARDEKIKELQEKT